MSTSDLIFHNISNLAFFLFFTANILLCFVPNSLSELQRVKHSAKADGSLISFLVVGDWGRRGLYNQSQVALQVKALLLHHHHLYLYLYTHQYIYLVVERTHICIYKHKSLNYINISHIYHLHIYVKYRLHYHWHWSPTNIPTIYTICKALR